MKRFEKKKDHIIDNFPDYNDYNATILTFLKSNYPNKKINGYNYFPEYENGNGYVNINDTPVISISDIERMRKNYEISEKINDKIINASTLNELGYPFANAGMPDIILQILKDRLTNGFMLSYSHGVVLSQRRGDNLYRGENDSYGFSKASAYRNSIIPYPYSLFISFLKIETLKIILGEMEFIKNWRCGDILYDAIAQHYGLRTVMLDITSNIDVALFFACCYYDPYSKKYFPYTKAEQKYSVLYFASNGLIEWLNNRYINQNVGVKLDIQPIGFQPFMRCSRQHGYALYTTKKDDFYKNPIFSKVRILHDDEFVEFSNYIYNVMDKGEKLFPIDEGYYMQLLIEKIDKAIEFSSMAFQEAYKKWNFSVSKTQLNKKLNMYGIKIRKYVDYSLGTLINDIEKIWGKYNFFNTGEVVPRNRPIIRGLDGKDWGGFYIQSGWGCHTREESTEKMLNENVTND